MRLVWSRSVGSLTSLNHSMVKVCDKILLLLTAWGEMRYDCTALQNKHCYDLLPIHSWDNFTENVQPHPLAIDNGGSLVINMQYHSQTVFVMNHSQGLQLPWYSCDIPTVVEVIKFKLLHEWIVTDFYFIVPLNKILSDFHKQNMM